MLTDEQMSLMARKTKEREEEEKRKALEKKKAARKAGKFETRVRRANTQPINRSLGLIRHSFAIKVEMFQEVHLVQRSRVR